MLGWKWVRAGHRVWLLSIEYSLFDSPRQARAKRTVAPLGAQPSQRGTVIPCGWHKGLPSRFLIWAKVGLRETDLDGFTDEVNHYLDEVYQLRRVPGSSRLDLTVAPPLPERAPWPALDPTDAPFLIPLGVSRLGPVCWSVASADPLPHLLVGAGTGWGKSTLIGNVLGYVTAAGGWQVYGLDPDGELDAWQGHPGVLGIAATPSAQAATLERVDAEAEARSAAFAGGQTWEQIIADRGRLLVVLDEEAAIWRDASDATRSILVALLQRGRKRGIHVLAATQQPNAKVLPTELRDQFAARLAGQLSPQGYDMVLGERPRRRQPNRPGLGWWRQPDGTLVELQAYAPRRAPGPRQTAAKGTPTDAPPRPSRPARPYGAGAPRDGGPGAAPGVGEGVPKASAPAGPAHAAVTASGGWRPPTVTRTASNRRGSS